MKKRSLFIVSVFITLFFSPFVAEVQCESLSARTFRQNRNTISGYVFDQQRRPVAELYVELQNEVYSTLARTRTNGAGRFFFGGLSAGRFYVRVLTNGTNLEEQTQDNFLSCFLPSTVGLK